MKRAILSVTNDLYTDPRVDKVALFLTRKGVDVTLVGRRYGDSPTLEKRPYKTKRMRLLFRRGWIFYAEYNLRLFFYLLFKKCDILVANDLDTLLPNFLVSKMRRKKLVYDSHEYFCGDASVVNNPAALKVWSAIERFCFPKLKTVITVSPSIVDQYEKEYGVRPYLVRNIPTEKSFQLTATRKSLGMPKDKTIIILQGNYLIAERGGEEIVEAMQYLPEHHLFIVGKGSVIPQLKQMAKELDVEERVTFVPRQTPENLFNYTALADIGISLDKDVSANAHFSLPNKIFEYIKAGLPLVISNLPDRVQPVRQYQIGEVVKDITAEAAAEAVKKISVPETLSQYRENCKIAAKELTWENEEKVLETVYLPLI